MADYVTNKELFDDFVVYNKLYKESIELGNERPPLSPIIASAIIRISNKMVNHFRFVSYSYKDDMVSDAILKCFEKAHNFDPAIGSNPFAYLSQIVWNAFIGRIKEEQYYTSIKAKMCRTMFSDEFFENSLEADTDVSNDYVSFLKDNEVFIDYIEESRIRRQDELNGKVKAKIKHKNLTAHKKIVTEDKPAPAKVVKYKETNLWDELA